MLQLGLSKLLFLEVAPRPLLRLGELVVGMEVLAKAGQGLSLEEFST